MIGFLGIGKHSKLKTLLSSYLDDQVSPGERGEVEEHIATCSECRRDLETLRMSVDILRGLPQLETAKLFRLEAAPEPLRASGLPAWATGLATSAAAVLLAVLVIGETLDVFRQAGAVEPEVVVKEARAEAETAVTDVAVPTAGVEAERAAVEEPDVERADEPAAPPVVVEEMAVESAVAAAAPVAAAADAAVGAAPEPRAACRIRSGRRRGERAPRRPGSRAPTPRSAPGGRGSEGGEGGGRQFEPGSPGARDRGHHGRRGKGRGSGA